MTVNHIALKVVEKYTPIHNYYMGERIRIAIMNNATPKGGVSFKREFLLYESGDYTVVKPQHIDKVMKDFEMMNGETKWEICYD